MSDQENDLSFSELFDRTYIQDKKEKESDCVQIYRYRESTFMRGDSIVTTSSWTPMRRMSCKGYKDSRIHGDRTRCFGPTEDAHEVSADHIVINCDNPVNGKLYRAVFVPGGIEWRTGYVDDWEWKMIPWEPEEKESK